MKRLLFLLCLLPLIFSASDTTSAGGGFVTTDEEPIELQSMNLRYIVDSDAGTITAEIEQRIWGRSEHYLWLYPVPDDNPTIEFITERFQYFRADSSLQYPPNYCTDVYQYYPQYGSGGGPEPARTEVNAVNQVVEGDQIVQWLSDNYYVYSPQQLDVIADYAEQGMSFVAVDYTVTVISDEGYGNFARFMPIRITYEADELIVPLRLTGLGHKRDYWGAIVGRESINRTNLISTNIRIEGEGRYHSTNFPNVEMDYSRIRGLHNIGNRFPDSSENPWSYSSIRSAALRVGDGRVFFTEFAGRLEESKPWDPYITRLYARIPLTSMNQDIHFELDPYGRDTEDIDLAELVDSLEFYGCSTRTLRRGGRYYIGVDYADIEKDLPDGFSWTLNRPTRHPEDWIYSEFLFSPMRGLIRAYSPEKVTPEMIIAYFNGAETSPMLLYLPTELEYQNFFSPRAFEALELPFRRYQRIRLSRSIELPVTWGLGEWIIILASDEDFARNEAMYRAMVNYRFTFRYLRHPELMHTIFYRNITIAYPDGWIERMEDGERMIIAPEDAFDTESAPYIRVFPVDDIANDPIDRVNLDSQPVIEVISNLMAERYNIDRETIDEALQASLTCTAGITVPFSVNGRTGYIGHMVYTSLLVEISAPDDIYPEYAETFEQMTQVFDTPRACG